MLLVLHSGGGRAPRAGQDQRARSAVSALKFYVSPGLTRKKEIATMVVLTMCGITVRLHGTKGTSREDVQPNREASGATL